MTEPFRYSPHPNRAHEIDWRPWSRAAFDEAAADERLIFLHVTTSWCEACHEMDDEAFSDDRVIRTLNSEVVPVRVDGDRLPHVQDRYIAGGWPTNAVLAPSGEVFWSDTLINAAGLRRAIQGVLEAWADRRGHLLGEIERRGKAMDAARSRRSAQRMVRREAADDVLTGAQQQFDPRNGGFGDAPKFIHAEGVELLFTQGEALPNPDWVGMAERTLDGMMAGEIQDPVDGGFFHYALEADWTRPQVEKLLSINARTLTALAVGVDHLGRDDWSDAAARTVEWVETTLGRNGLWAGSQAADQRYHAADRDARADLEPPRVEDTVYADSAGMWIAALAEAGRRLNRDDWVQRASEGLDTWLETMASGVAVVHYDAPEGEPPSGLLADLMNGARAAVAVERAAGRSDALDAAERLVKIMRDTLWDERGGFIDCPRTPEPLGALRYTDRPFEENALAARLHLDLARRTGDASYRAVAERILGFLSPQAGRYGVEGATFAMGVDEFFQRSR